MLAGNIKNSIVIFTDEILKKNKTKAGVTE